MQLSNDESKGKKRSGDNWWWCSDGRNRSTDRGRIKLRRSECVFRHRKDLGFGRQQFFPDTHQYMSPSAKDLYRFHGQWKVIVSPTGGRGLPSCVHCAKNMGWQWRPLCPHSRNQDSPFPVSLQVRRQRLCHLPRCSSCISGDWGNMNSVCFTLKSGQYLTSLRFN